MQKHYRSYFPYFDAPNAKTSVYLDSAATSHKMQSALDEIERYHTLYNANVHRGTYSIAKKATDQFELARAKLGRFLNASAASQIVFTSGATDAVNTIMRGLDSKCLNGNEILICESEHHANIVPWQYLAKRFNFKIKVMPLEKDGRFTEETLNRWRTMINENTAIVACAHVSNVLGNIYPIKAICSHAKKVKAISVIDGTQAAAHLTIDVSHLDCDFYFFSGHKMYGPNGIGVLYGKQVWLDSLTPSKFGGEMIEQVTWEVSTFQPSPLKFEGGTPNISGAIGLAAAAEFIQTHHQEIFKHEVQLYKSLFAKLNELVQIKIYGNRVESIPLIAFSVDAHHPFDVTTALNEQGIAIRSGHHCAMPLMQKLGVDGCLRVSLACYNTENDIDAFIEALQKLLKRPSDREDESSDHVTLKPSLSNTEKSESMLLKQHPIARSRSWNEKHRQLMLLSKQLKTLPFDQRIPDNEVGGCEAHVWLANYANEKGNVNLFAYSSSKVIRGILFVLLCASEHYLTKHEDTSDLISFLHHHLDELGLSAFFSQGRRDGVNAVINRIAELFS